MFRGPASQVAQSPPTNGFVVPEFTVPDYAAPKFENNPASTVSPNLGTSPVASDRSPGSYSNPQSAAQQGLAPPKIHIPSPPQFATSNSATRSPVASNRAVNSIAAPNVPAFSPQPLVQQQPKIQQQSTVVAQQRQSLPNPIPQKVTEAPAWNLPETHPSVKAPSWSTPPPQVAKTLAPPPLTTTPQQQRSTFQAASQPVAPVDQAATFTAPELLAQQQPVSRPQNPIAPPISMPTPSVAPTATVSAPDSLATSAGSRLSAWGASEPEIPDFDSKPAFVLPEPQSTNAPSSSFASSNSSPPAAAAAPQRQRQNNMPTQLTSQSSQKPAPTLTASLPRNPTAASQNGLGDLAESSRVIALIGNQPILAGDILGQINEMLKPYEGKAPQEELDQQRQLLLKQALPGMIDNKLIFLDFMRKFPADKLPNLEKSIFDAFAESELPKLMKKAEVNSAKELDAKLRSLGSSMEKQRRLFMEKAIAQQMIREKVAVNRDIKHDELLQYFEDNLSEYTLEARAKFEHLMARFDKFNELKQDGTLPTQEEIRIAAYNYLVDMGNQVMGGAPSADVAKRSSHGPLAAVGGIYDWTTQGSLVSEPLDKAIFALPQNKWSQIIEDDQGVHIIRVTDREPAGEVAFGDVQNEIAEAIQKKRFETGVRKYLARLRSSTHIQTIFDENETQLARPPGNSTLR